MKKIFTAFMLASATFALASCGKESEATEVIDVRVGEDAIEWRASEKDEWCELAKLASLSLVKDDLSGIKVRVVGDNIKYSVNGGEEITICSLDDIRGPRGFNADRTEFQVADGYIQWKYSNNTEWVNLVSLSSIKGDKGDTPEIRVNDNYIQWKYVGLQEWSDIICLDELKGKDAPVKETGFAYFYRAIDSVDKENGDNVLDHMIYNTNTDFIKVYKDYDFITLVGNSNRDIYYRVDVNLRAGGVATDLIYAYNSGKSEEYKYVWMGMTTNFVGSNIMYDYNMRTEIKNQVSISDLTGKGDVANTTISASSSATYIVKGGHTVTFRLYGNECDYYGYDVTITIL